jgi:hypothetical protein
MKSKKQAHRISKDSPNPLMGHRLLREREQISARLRALDIQHRASFIQPLLPAWRFPAVKDA